MKGHLFLQGDIRIGKSTLIRNTILPYLKYIGGYFVQRIYLNNRPGKYVGFAVKPLETKETYKLNSYVNCLNDVRGLFLYCNQSGTWQQIPESFTKNAINILRNAIYKKKRLIIMDELGGMELEDDRLLNLVFDILDGNIPVIGVLKSPLNLQKLRKVSGGRNDAAIERVQHKYNKIKNHKNVTVLTLTKSGDIFIKKRLREFAEGVFEREEC